jgi:hypothetical protein
VNTVLGWALVPLVLITSVYVLVETVEAVVSLWRRL